VNRDSLTDKLPSDTISAVIAGRHAGTKNPTVAMHKGTLLSKWGRTSQGLAQIGLFVEEIWQLNRDGPK
jgi:hypothetical protein